MKERKRKGIKKQSKEKAVFLLVVGITVWYLILVAYQSFLAPMLPSGVPEAVRMALGSMAVPYLIAFPIFLLIVHSLKKQKCEGSVITGKQGVSYFIIQSGISMPVLLLVNIICMALGVNGGSAMAESVENNMAFYAVLLLLFNPVMEEVFFRKCALERLLPYGNKFAIIASAVLFAIPHAFSQGIAGMFYAFVIAIVWADVTIKTGSLKSAIILHALANVWGMYGAVFLTKTPIGTVCFVSIWYVVMPIIAITLLVKKRREQKLKVSMESHL